MGINDYIKIGSKIKEARIEKGIKQNEMANLLNINVSTYSNYENDYREPEISLIYSICDILKISIDELLNLKQKEVKISFSLELSEEKYKEYKEKSESEGKSLNQYIIDCIERG